MLLCDSVTTYNGRLAGEADTHGRFTITRQRVEGVVFTAEERYYVEQLRRYLACTEGEGLVVYRVSDIKSGQWWQCGLSLPGRLQRG